ncbi:MAG: ferrochelatase [Gemmatimonadota bacterium]
MRTAVLLLNFGEPEDASLEEIVDFLDRIFTANAALEPNTSPREARVRSRRLAEARAESLLEDYRLIGGSPMNAQAREQADLVAAALERPGHDTAAFIGMQFTDPSIPAAMHAAADWGAERLVALPVYPVCGPSTTIAALGLVRAELGRTRWKVPLFEIRGWYTSPAYVELRAAAIRDVADRSGLSLTDGSAELVFSAHGTPLQYLAGSDYGSHVEEHCRAVAAALGLTAYRLGYQNHAHRPTVPWTQPEIADVIRNVASRAVIVDPISFVHEQSETLVELDHELRAVAEGRGLRFERVPIAHDSPAFINVLAALVEPLLPSRRHAAVYA